MSFTFHFLFGGFINVSLRLHKNKLFQFILFEVNASQYSLTLEVVYAISCQVCCMLEPISLLMMFFFVEFFREEAKA